MTLKAINIGGTYKNLVEADRAAMAATFGSRPGVLFTYAATQGACTDLQVAPNGALHSVTVGVGKGIVMEKSSPIARGGYMFIADAVEVVTMPTPTSQPFIATVIARVTDPQYGTVAGAVGPRIDVVSGTPAASPVAVADAVIDAVTQTPGGWIRLSDVRINTADTAGIPGGQFTDRRQPAGVGAMVKGWIATAVPTTGASRGDLFHDFPTGTVYSYNGTAWVMSATGALPACRLLTSTVTTTSGTFATYGSIAFNLESYDDLGMHDNVTNNSRITIPTSGTYRLKGRARASAGGSLGLRFTVNGTSIVDTETWAGYAASAYADCAVDTTVYLTAGQYVELQAANTAVSIALSAAWCVFEAVFVRP